MQLSRHTIQLVYLFLVLQWYLLLLLLLRPLLDNRWLCSCSTALP